MILACSTSSSTRATPTSRVRVDEADGEVVVSVRNNDRALFITGGDDCQDLVAVELESPLGDRRLVLEDGSEITLTTFPIDD